MRMFSTVLGIAGWVTAFWGAGCSQQNTYRDDALRQNAVESAQRDAILAPVIGTYCGNMHMVDSGADFQVELVLARGEDNLHSSQSTDPTLTAQVPKLAGGMHFPKADAAGEDLIHAYPELYMDMGGVGAVTFDNGDFTPSAGSTSNGKIYLPFSVPGHTNGEYGEVSGTITNGEFTGSWNANAFRSRGNFDVVPGKCPAGGSSS